MWKYVYGPFDHRMVINTLKFSLDTSQVFQERQLQQDIFDNDGQLNGVAIYINIYVGIRMNRKKIKGTPYVKTCYKG